MATIDNAEWHYASGSFPAGLPLGNAGTHIGMFLAWTIERGLASAFLHQLLGPTLESIRQRAMTGREALFSCLDEKLTESMLLPAGQQFARWYYQEHLYLADFSRTLAGGHPSAYHVEDSWEQYDRLATRIAERFEEFEATGLATRRVVSDGQHDAVERYADVISAAMRALPSDPVRAVQLLEGFSEAEPMGLVAGMARREASRLRERFGL